jgi:hypothetical protein
VRSCTGNRGARTGATARPARGWRDGASGQGRRRHDQPSVERLTRRPGTHAGRGPLRSDDFRLGPGRGGDGLAWTGTGGEVLDIGWRCCRVAADSSSPAPLVT